jgi:hypothetical protein
MYYNVHGKGAGMRVKAAAYVLVAFFVAAIPAGLWAAEVGSLIQAEGNVEIFRQGKLPAVPAKVGDPLAPGDSIRTKNGARAQVRFIDDTVLTIAPGSLVAIERYLYDGPQGVRQAALNVMRGLVACVVSRLIKAEQPTFLLQTHTAVLGVRGTEWYTLLGAAYTSAFNETGELEVSSLQKEITKKVVLGAGETSTVALNQPPTDPVRYPDALRRLLQKWLQNGVPDRVIIMSPMELPWLRAPMLGLRAPDMLEEFPEGLFVPPRLPSPTLPSPEPPVTPPVVPPDTPKGGPTGGDLIDVTPGG